MPADTPASRPSAPPSDPREETFAEVLARRCTPEEAAGIRAVLAYQQRRLPEDVLRSSVVRALASFIGGPLTCDFCGCPTLFVEEEDVPRGQPDVDACPLCNPTLAFQYMRLRYLADSHFPELIP